ncbi:MAG: M48 family metalloprotease [Burkholderiaceae bacterium]|nr:M48 family metalloprotease [Burkholderiaceae bacterium]
MLHRSQQARLDSLPTAERGTPAAVVVHLSLQRLVRALELHQPIELRIVSGDTVAETVHGRIVVANEALAALPEGERMFILAHELGHVVLGHWSQMGNLYQQYIPGKVTQAKTDAVSDALGRAASGMVRRQEFDADAFALRTLRELGYADAHALSALSRFGFHRDSATHPGTRQRLAALCAIDAIERESAGIETAGIDDAR